MKGCWADIGRAAMTSLTYDFGQVIYLLKPDLLKAETFEEHVPEPQFISFQKGKGRVTKREADEEDLGNLSLSHIHRHTTK